MSGKTASLRTFLTKDTLCGVCVLMKKYTVASSGQNEFCFVSFSGFHSLCCF